MNVHSPVAGLLLTGGTSRRFGSEAALWAQGHHGGAVVLACDLPRVEEELVRWLARQVGTAVPVVDGQSLCARYDADALALAPVLAGAGTRALQALLDAVPLTRVTENDWRHVAEPDDFADIDTPADAERLLGGAAASNAGSDAPRRRPAVAPPVSRR